MTPYEDVWITRSNIGMLKRGDLGVQWNKTMSLLPPL